ncbi:MAG: L,D-transpeptidase, partial [Actinomycetota bacterium]|nr:L,D-transpeptidase [Actinomycetota bacterium]
MRGRRWVFAVVAAIFCVGIFVAVSWPRGLSTSVSSGKGPLPPGRSASFGNSVPAGPGVAAPPIAAPAPAPEPEPTITLDRGNGRRLAVGVARPVTSPATIADAVVAQVGLYSAPGGSEPDDWLDNPTWEGLPVVFLVQERQGDWLQVQVSMRPNMATAWIRASDVTLRQTPYHVFIDLASRTLTAYNGQNVVLRADVAPGTDATPTPTGDFFV